MTQQSTKCKLTIAVLGDWGDAQLCDIEKLLTGTASHIAPERADYGAVVLERRRRDASRPAQPGSCPPRRWRTSSAG